MNKLALKSFFAITSVFLLQNNGYTRHLPPIEEAATVSALAEQSIEVEGVKNPEWKSYHLLFQGFDAFERNRSLAPTASMRFALRPLKDDLSMKGITLRVESPERTMTIELDEHHRFSLPRDQRLVDEGAELIVNRKKNLMSIRPDIRTPGLPPNVRRLGDLRLECHVRWAIQKDELSFIKRNAFRMLGGPCKSETVKTFFFADGILKNAWLSASGHKAQLVIAGNGRLFRPPLHDNSWGDDALVVLEFAHADMASNRAENATSSEERSENTDK